MRLASAFLGIILGAAIGWFILSKPKKSWTFWVGTLFRVQPHYGLSGFWAFIFINLLILGALLQPWIPLNQIGLWIAVLVLGLIFWDANLLILERKGQWKTG